MRIRYGVLSAIVGLVAIAIIAIFVLDAEGTKVLGGMCITGVVALGKDLVEKG